MGKIVITEFVSLDGVMEDPGGAEDYEHGGWTFAIDRGADGDKFKGDEGEAAVALLLGRTTFEMFEPAWSARTVQDDPGAPFFNDTAKYVVSSTLSDPSWNNTTVLGGDFVDEVTKLKDSLDGEIVVHGSAQLAQGLIEHDLADELRLMVFPVVLGSGKRLFGASGKKSLRLTSSQTVGDGIAILVYESK